MTNSQDNKVTIIPLHKPALKEKLFFLISGILLSVPFTLFIYQFTNSLLYALPIFYATLFATVVFAPFIEEFAKVYPLFYRHGETQRSLFTLSFLVGLGFGFFEFLSYVILLGTPIPDRLSGIFLHPMSSSITGYGIAKRHTMQFYLIAVALHFSANLTAFYPLWPYLGLTAFYPLWPNLGVLAVLLLAYFLSWRFYHKTSEKFVD